MFSTVCNVYMVRKWFLELPYGTIDARYDDSCMITHGQVIKLLPSSNVIDIDGE